MCFFASSFSTKKLSIEIYGVSPYPCTHFSFSSLFCFSILLYVLFNTLLATVYIHYIHFLPSTMTSPILLILALLLGVTAVLAEDEFALVWVCIPITVVGCIIVYIIAFLRPKHLILPGGTVYTAQESEAYGGEKRKAVYSEY